MTPEQLDILITSLVACFCVLAFGLGFLSGQKAA